MNLTNATKPAITESRRAPKRAQTVLLRARGCSEKLRIVRLIQPNYVANLLANAALVEVAAAERFRCSFGFFKTLFDSDPRLQTSTVVVE